jgi:hypothetical protein
MLILILALLSQSPFPQYNPNLYGGNRGYNGMNYGEFTYRYNHNELSQHFSNPPSYNRFRGAQLRYYNGGIRVVPNRNYHRYLGR